MKKALVMTIAAALTLGLAGPASAAIKITKIYFDSPGADTGSNTSLIAEYRGHQEHRDDTQDPHRWTLRDASRHVYKFRTFRLGAGKSVKVHTGKGANTLGNLYWRSSSYIWNNDGDTATLKRSNGSVASRCSYTGAGSYKIC